MKAIVSAVAQGRMNKVRCDSKERLC